MVVESGPIRPEHRVVLIKIRSVPRDAEALHAAVSRWWVVAASRRDGGPASPEYALAVHGGRVVAAYGIQGWEPKPGVGVPSRWGFQGVLSEELTRLYRGVDVTPYFARGAANPLRYVHCGSTPLRGSADPGEIEDLPSGQPEIVRVVERLEREPLTHLMLGHRELFHSNLLGWFFESLAGMADSVFQPLTGADPANQRERRALREKDHLDLQLHWPGSRPLVLELKVFSLPDEDQLARYSQVAEPAAALWLLSTSDPNWVDDRALLGGREWRWLSFADLAGRIRAALPAGDASYEVETMRRYALVGELLEDLVACAVPRGAGERVRLGADVRASFGESRLLAAVEKLRAYGVTKWLQEGLRREGIAFGDVTDGYTHGKPVNSWFGGTGIAGALAGWQYQDGQFRLALITPHLAGETEAAWNERCGFAKQHEAFFDFAEVDQALGTAASPVVPSPGPKAPHGFRRFNPDFVYRYKPARDLTLGQLERAAIVVARRVQAMFGSPASR